MKVAFQGERGAYSEEAIIQHFGPSITPVPRPYFRDVFMAVERGEADLGLVPVENTLMGSIVQNYDLLNERPLKARGEVILRIVGNLIANPGVKLEDVKKVYSQPPALAQCRDYLEEHGMEALAAYDTAGSVKIVKDEGYKDAAAIASKRAAEVYNMEILAHGIESHAENYTRFLVIGEEDHEPTGKDKTSLAFIVAHRPGTLHRALQAFAEVGINLTKIESRPLVGSPWEYIFFIDLIGHKKDPDMKRAIENLQNYATSVKILGSYPQAETNE
jgi:prephenate dehydratase